MAQSTYSESVLEFLFQEKLASFISTEKPSSFSVGKPSWYDDTRKQFFFPKSDFFHHLIISDSLD